MPANIRSPFREDGPSTVPARLGAALFVAVGLLVVASTLFLPDNINRVPIALCAAVAAGLGLVVWFVPWAHVDQGVLVMLPVGAFAMIGLAGWYSPYAIDRYMPLYVIVFVVVGVIEPPIRVLQIAPVAVLSYLAAAAHGAGPESAFAFAFTLPVAMLAGCAISIAVQRQQRLVVQIEQLLESTQALTRTVDVTATAQELESRVRALVEAEFVHVFVADHPGSSRYITLTPTRQGWPDLLSIDITEGQSGVGKAIAEQRALWVPDAETSPDVSPRLCEIGHVKAVLYVPLPGEDGRLGTLVIAWEHPRGPLNDTTLRAIQVIVGETGTVLERQRKADRTAREAATDPLTGLANRRSIDARFATIQPNDAVLIVDVDHFKLVNDTLGHPAGDRVLRSLAGILTEVLRPEDWCGRLGGDEFIMVLHDAGICGAEAMMRRLLEAWQSTEPEATISGGVAVHSDVADPRQTLTRADEALYQAKRTGRGSMVRFSEP